MSNKFFRNQQALFMFDPETYRTFVYNAGKWVETNESDCLDEIRFRTVELSISEATDTIVLNRGEEQKVLLRLSCRKPDRFSV
jgi:hypothetical protein